MMRTNHENRILALDPANRGVGFAVMEGPEQLIDWGVKGVEGYDNRRYVKKVKSLVEFYRPDAIVVENISRTGSRRCDRVRKMIQDIAVLALNKRIRIHYISRSMIKERFAESGAKTKNQIAEYIAELLPELACRIPPLRKSWMSEDYRMAIFDAVAFSLTFYYAE